MRSTCNMVTCSILVVVAVVVVMLNKQYTRQYKTIQYIYYDKFLSVVVLSTAGTSKPYVKQDASSN